jgi:hypothetical protein
LPSEFWQTLGDALSWYLLALELVIICVINGLLIRSWRLFRVVLAETNNLLLSVLLNFEEMVSLVSFSGC